MKIESPNESKIIVELTDDDMLELDITYDEMDYSNIETRRVIWTLLDKARVILGKDIDPSGKLVIETLPRGNGGCVIFFTVPEIPSDEAFQSDSEEKCYTYEFDSIDNVIDLLSHLKKSYNYSPPAELYSDNKSKYRLVTLQSTENNILKSKFREYGRLCGEGNIFAQSTREHWFFKTSSFFSK